MTNQKILVIKSFRRLTQNKSLVFLTKLKLFLYYQFSCSFFFLNHYSTLYYNLTLQRIYLRQIKRKNIENVNEHLLCLRKENTKENVFLYFQHRLLKFCEMFLSEKLKRKYSKTDKSFGAARKNTTELIQTFYYFLKGQCRYSFFTFITILSFLRHRNESNLLLFKVNISNVM